LFETAIGTCGVAYGKEGIIAVLLPSHSDASTERALARLARDRTGAPSTRDEAPPSEVRALEAELRDHFAGKPKTFTDVRLDLRGLSEFRCAVYRAAREIPSGQVQTYAEVAKHAGSPGAARAVGRALATNPFAVVVPCHRVLGSERDLHGFSAPGGVKTKARLLMLEGAKLDAPATGHTPTVSADQASFPFDS
jgi:methylated-DNA-[protein]-cysteine S-methyltransferase